MAEKQEVDEDYNYWLGQIASYEREFKKWEGRVKKIIKRYKDDNRSGNKGYQEAHFNILWSNVQTLSAATFSKLPKPDVSRRFKDTDPVGRVASLILERALEYEIQKYTDYGSTMQASICDRFLGGRGTSWVRYEPHFRAIQQQLPTDGVQITEDIDEPEEELDYECAPCDYVHWQDFGHSVARTWEEVTAVWRVVYLTREQCLERFGEELGRQIPLDSRPESMKDFKNVETDENKSRARIYEIWDKTEKQALWLSKSVGKIIDERDDPLGLDEFFPCPQPLYSTLTNDSLEPVPDFTLYQDQANQLDIICDRIDGLVKGLKIAGTYDASSPVLQRIFTEAENNTLVPHDNWAKFSEKGGLKGSLDLVDLTPLAAALREQYLAFEQVKNQIYEITGISDIIRGQTQASETATAQQIKGQYASLRLKSYQDEVASYATELLRIKAQIICNKFSPKTIQAIAAVDQLNQADQEYVQRAMELLVGPERMKDPNAEAQPNALRTFRVEVDADTLVYLDEQEEKQSRIEFIQAVSTFVGQFASVPQSIGAEMAPLAMELLKFGTTAFKVGKGIEGKMDQWADSMVQKLSQPSPVDNSPMIQAQADMKKHMDEMQARQGEQQISSQMEQFKQQAETQREGLKRQHEAQLEFQRQEHEKQMAAMEQQLKTQELDFNRWKAELENATKIEVAQISAKAGLDQLALSAEQAASKEITEDLSQQENMKEILSPLLDMHGKTLEAIQGLSQTLQRPKNVIRSKDGKIIGIT